MTNTQRETDPMGGMAAGLPGSQPGSNMPGSTSSSTSGDGESGMEVSVQAGGLPG